MTNMLSVEKKAIQGRSTNKRSLNPSERPRIQLDFTPDAFEHLKQLKVRGKAKSVADLSRNALRLYEWYLDKQDQGYELLLAREGEVKRVELLF